MTKQQSTFMQPGALTEHLAGFTHELESVGYTKLTVAGYSMSVAHFAEWARRRDQLESDWCADGIDRFARHRCRCRGGRRWHRVSGKYVRRVRRFIRYLERQGVIESRAEALPAADHQRPELAVSEVQLRADFRRALDALPAEQRDVFVLYEESGLSLEEIGKVTGVAMETAKSRLRYAVSKLRAALKQHQPASVQT